MVDEPNSSRFSLRRWSQRKLEVSRGGNAPREARSDERAADSLDATRQTSTGIPLRGLPDAGGTAERPAAAQAPAAQTAAATGSAVEPRLERAGEVSLPELPPIDSLTIDSDFSPFMAKDVDATVRQSALKKLFRDPRFNVMDGLDVYIDDYSKPDPIEPEIVRTLVQARYIFNPPATRVNEQGYVEDVPEEDLPKFEEQAEQANEAGVEKSDASAVANPSESTASSEGLSDMQQSSALPINAAHAQASSQTGDDARGRDVASDVAPRDVPAIDRP